VLTAVVFGLSTESSMNDKSTGSTTELFLDHSSTHTDPTGYWEDHTENSTESSMIGGFKERKCCVCHKSA